MSFKGRDIAIELLHYKGVYCSKQISFVETVSLLGQHQLLDVEEKEYCYHDAAKILDRIERDYIKQKMKLNSCIELLHFAEPLYHTVEILIEALRNQEIERALSLSMIMKSYLKKPTGRTDE